MITKHLLFDSEFSSKKQIISAASGDAHKILFDVLVSFPKNGVLSIWDKIKNLVMKPFSKKSKTDIVYTKEVQTTIPITKA